MVAFLYVASYMPNFAAFLQKIRRKARGKESLKIRGNSIYNQVRCVDTGLNKTAVKKSQWYLAMWHTPVIPVFGRWKQEDQEFKVILSYRASSRPV